MGGPVTGDAGGEFDVDYLSEAIAIDFRGGERLAGRRGNSLGLTAAGEMLLLEPDGTLAAHNALDDQSACDELTKAETEAAQQKAAAGPMGPMGPGMGPGMTPPGMGPGMTPGMGPLDGPEGRPPKRKPAR